MKRILSPEKLPTLLLTHLFLLLLLPRLALSERILVTGGAGYIGSHTCVALMEAGHDIFIIDNFANSSETALTGIENITGKKPASREVDLTDRDAVFTLFEDFSFSAVIHFAGLKAVGESSQKPLDYYRVNVGGTINLLEAMSQHQVYHLVFSSSASVYGKQESFEAIEENTACSPESPYGRTKLHIENMLSDLTQASDSSWCVAILRYFNPVGAHESQQLGENPKGEPNNLVPIICQVAAGKKEQLEVFGDDYETLDGTCIRDYIHVVDLSDGHIKALKYLKNHNGLHTWNLGSGHGYTVFDVIHTFNQVNNIGIPYVISAPRPGDVARLVADTSKARQELGWSACKTLENMVKDAWKWAQSKNP